MTSTAASRLTITVVRRRLVAIFAMRRHIAGTRYCALARRRQVTAEQCPQMAAVDLCTERENQKCDGLEGGHLEASRYSRAPWLNGQARLQCRCHTPSAVYACMARTTSKRRTRRSGAKRRSAPQIYKDKDPALKHRVDPPPSRKRLPAMNPTIRTRRSALEKQLCAAIPVAGGRTHICLNVVVVLSWRKPSRSCLLEAHGWNPSLGLAGDEVVLSSNGSDDVGGLSQLEMQYDVWCPQLPCNWPQQA